MCNTFAVYFQIFATFGYKKVKNSDPYHFQMYRVYQNEMYNPYHFEMYRL